MAFPATLLHLFQVHIDNLLDLLRNMIKENPGVDHLLVCMARDSGSRQDWVSKAF